MAAPDYVPTDPIERVRKYTSPPRRADSWFANRPGDIDGLQPEGERLGSQGPDQGYALKLVKLFDDRLHCGGLARADVDAGCVAVGLKRAALYGRAPIVHDLTAGYTLFGFLDADADEELVALRERMFAQIHSSHHYREQRAVVDLVRDDALRQPPIAIEKDYRADWTTSLHL